MKRNKNFCLDPRDATLLETASHNYSEAVKNYTFDGFSPTTTCARQKSKPVLSVWPSEPPKSFIHGPAPQSPMSFVHRPRNTV